MDRTDLVETMDRLIDGWCAKRNLEALRLVLPAYPLVNGLTDEWAELNTALRQVRISCREQLDPEEMDVLVAVIHEVQKALDR
jgi:hypothetical protein